jgi:hypothetical protein
VTAARAVLLGVVLPAFLAACAHGSGGANSARSGDRTSPGGDASNRIEFGAIRQRLAGLPSVIQVHGGYSHDPSNAGGDVLLSITVRPGTDLAAVAEDAVREVWLSRLTPVASMTAAIGPDDNPGATIYRHADFHDDRTLLAARYGPRPVVR